MNDLIHALSHVGRLSIGGFWLPLITWTVPAAVVLVSLGRRRSLHPYVQCDLRSALLMSLPVGVLLAAFVEAPFSVLAGPNVAIVERIAPGPLPMRPSPDLSFWIGTVTVGAGMAALVRLTLLARDVLQLHRFRRSLHWIEPEALERHHPARLDGRRIRYAVSRQEIVPMTFGFLRPVVVLPASLLEKAEDLRMVLRHEHAHVRRRDYLRQWFEQVVAAVFVVHPLTGLLRRQIAAYREHACDAEVLADPASDAYRYALLLYRVGAAAVRVPRPGLQMAGRKTDLQTRIRAMETYQRDVRKLRRVRRRSFAAGAVLLLTMTGTIAACDLAGQANANVRAPASNGAPAVPEAQTTAVDDARQPDRSVRPQRQASRTPGRTEPAPAGFDDRSNRKTRRSVGPGVVSTGAAMRMEVRPPAGEPTARPPIRLRSLDVHAGSNRVLQAQAAVTAATFVVLSGGS